MAKRVRLNDPEATEQLGAGSLIVVPEKSRFPADTFFQAMQDGFLYLAKYDLGRHEYRVMLALLAHMEYGNIVRVKQKYIADKLGMKPPYVSRAISNLIDKGLVFKDKTPEGVLIRVNAMIAWKGRATAEWRSQCAEDMQFVPAL